MHPITGVSRNGVFGGWAVRSAVPLPGEIQVHLRLRRTNPQLSDRPPVLAPGRHPGFTLLLLIIACEKYALDW